VTAIWAGVDAGRTHHHCVVIDDTHGEHPMTRTDEDRMDTERGTDE
jgi:hypothetical protein